MSESTIPDFATKLKKIRVLGAVSVERVSTIRPINRNCGYDVFVLLGPTGSGKSSFVEAVASNPSLGLSSSGLEGFTTSVSIYRIINAVVYNSPIYLVDMPGFTDSKISVMSIVSMLKDMIQNLNSLNLFVFHILYHMPINKYRLPGSQRQALRTFEALTGTNSAMNITFVSMMWDLIWNEKSSERAERNLSQLCNEIWKDYIAQGAEIVKFYNTSESALTILDNAFERSRAAYFRIQTSIRHPLRQTQFASNIYDDLQTRICGLQVEQANIQLDLQLATELSDEKRRVILITQLEEVQILLTKFKEELLEFRSPPDRPVTPELVPPTNNPACPTPCPGGILTRATNNLKQWRNNLSKQRASD
ncbi:hypothetical protein BJ165DRAFT_1530872 [Panaeolus papilionaceus]|nr:hypothetical protein BJ165DRAFT_1530872 [Panaeolus papilionaceus]